MVSHKQTSSYTPPAIMSLLYVIGMLGLLMKLAVPMCAPTDYTIYIERQECNYCVAVNTTICMGFCFSRVSGHSLVYVKLTLYIDNWVPEHTSVFLQCDKLIYTIDNSVIVYKPSFCRIQSDITIFPSYTLRNKDINKLSLGWYRFNRYLRVKGIIKQKLDYFTWLIV